MIIITKQELDYKACEEKRSSHFWCLIYRDLFTSFFFVYKGLVFVKRSVTIKHLVEHNVSCLKIDPTCIRCILNLSNIHVSAINF